MKDSNKLSSQINWEEFFLLTVQQLDLECRYCSIYRLNQYMSEVKISELGVYLTIGCSYCHQ